MSMWIKELCQNRIWQLWLGGRSHSHIPIWMFVMLGLYKPLDGGLSPQEDSEDGEIERRPSEELMSEAEAATEDGEDDHVCVTSLGGNKLNPGVWINWLKHKNSINNTNIKSYIRIKRKTRWPCCTKIADWQSTMVSLNKVNQWKQYNTKIVSLTNQTSKHHYQQLWSKEWLAVSLHTKLIEDTL